MTQPTRRIAMWSGPRNISTAMMRSWGARADTTVCDEPLYARYLKETGAEHPGREEIIERHEPDMRKIATRLTGPIPEGRTIFYQKHMAHHLLPGDDLAWTEALANCFLIRDPAEMITSYVKVVPNPTARDLGLPQQAELFRRERERLGEESVVLDSRDVLEDPRGMLGALCARVGVPFDEAMLSWAVGPRDTDGVWAKHWYANVEASTGFAAYKPKDEPLPERLAAVHDECRALYDALYDRRITT